MSTRRAREPFGPLWLGARLAQLLPAFPRVALCVGLSGGVDSTALLAALADLGASRQHRWKLRAIHVDHQLHPDSARWSAHCRALARALRVPLRVLSTQVPRAKGDSLEAAARERRYALLAANLHQDEVLLTAHHEDDQLETVLLQLFRGSGLAGIAAMPELTRFAAGWLARPLLSRTRQELEAWVRARGLAWVEDDTNANERLDRNYLRRTVLPLVRGRWPGVAHAVARSARHAAEGQRLLDTLARRDVERCADGASLSVSVLRTLCPDRRRNAVRYWIAHSAFPLPDTRRLEEICGPLLEARADANPHVVWGGARLQRHGGLLSIQDAPTTVSPAEPTEAAEEAGAIVWPWDSRGTCELPGAAGRLELRPDPRGPLDLDSLPPTVTVRERRGGERLRPMRGGPRRTLKNLLRESHIPVTERARLPLVFCGARLLAAADMWFDESIQARPGAPHRGRIRWRR
jgi:tRNA(Ile)-lysidine synthase